MSGFSFTSLTFILVVCFMVWSSSNFEACIAGRGRHYWNRGPSNSSPLSSSLNNKKKPKSHHSGHHQHGHAGSSKPKSPPHYKAAPPPAIVKPGDDTPPSPPKGHQSSTTTFNVLNFGAKGDGTTDDTKGNPLYNMSNSNITSIIGTHTAFQAAWAAACKVEASTLLVPAKYQFFVGPIEFSGPYCEPNIVFQLDGTIIAPQDPKAWGKGLFQWLLFSKLRGITVQGNGILEGKGSIRSKLSGIMPSIKPTALRFYGSFNVTVTGITIQNSPQCHLKFDNCVGVLVHDMSVSSPGDSANTDGIHLQNSKDVLIHTTTLACAEMRSQKCKAQAYPFTCIYTSDQCKLDMWRQTTRRILTILTTGDDCISIQTGCSNVYVHNVNCGPGHGISIGSLGRYNTKACVSNITVRDVMMHNTMNGVRIKTWQGGLGSVQGVLFSNIQVSEVQLPIVIDQFYCDKSSCKNQTSAVAVSGITYERIRGTYTVKPVHFACSDNLPCTDVTLNSIQLKPIQERYHMSDAFCWQTFGELRTPTVPPIGCLQMGKPSSNRLQSDHDSC
ncbi:hypothetical protein F8388_014856 [Cannabis sativa]|uniref:Polygalacturonase n=1 Tax=Cannabis sativa TaxID=3483 RepID=A0A7J6F6C7_CANSA|nr:hypothetical protein F8388_014856 [Cannabis sativa]